MTSIEGLFLWSAIGAYVLAIVLVFIHFIFSQAVLGRAGRSVLWASFALHSGAIVSRWTVTGHAPVMGPYENSLAGAWFITALLLGSGLRFDSVKRYGGVVIPFALFILGRGIMSRPELEPLAPQYRSPWLFVHVVFAWCAFSSYVAAAGMAVVYLVGRGRKAGLDGLSLRLISFGFLCHLLMIGAGSLWAYGLWGRYWGWDPIETWSLISWLIYGIYLHLRFTMGWKGKRAAWLALGALAAVIVSFFGVGFATSIHTLLL